MARTAITPAVVDRTGTVASPALAAMDQANGNSLVNNGRVFIEVKNTSTGAMTLTIPLPAVDLPDTQPGANLAFANAGVQYSLAANADILLGPFPAAIYTQSDGTIWLNPQTTYVQCRAVQLN